MRLLSYIFLLLLLPICALSNTRYTSTLPYNFTASQLTGGWDTLKFSGGTNNGVDTVTHAIDTMVPEGDTIFDTSWTITTGGSVLTITPAYSNPIPNYFDSLVIDMRNDSIVFNTNSTDQLTGITINSGSSGRRCRMVTLLGGYKLIGDDTLFGGIFQRSPDTTVNGTIGVAISGNNITLKNFNVYIHGFSFITDEVCKADSTPQWPYYINGYRVALTVLANSGGNGGNWNITIDGGKYIKHTTSFFDRCYYQGRAIDMLSCISGVTDSVGFLYHLRLVNAYIDSYGQGLVMTGYTGMQGVYDIENNYFISDARSDTLWTTDITGQMNVAVDTAGPGPGDDHTDTTCAYVCLGLSNQYAIFLRECSWGTIKNNTVKSGTLFGGCRGIMIERTGHPDSTTLIEGNYVETTEGPDPMYGDVEAHGIRVRYGSATYLKRHRVLRYNHIVTKSDNDENTSYAKTSAVALRYGDALDQPTYDSIYENTFESYAIDSAATTENTAVLFEVGGNMSSVYWANNTLISDTILVRFSKTNTGNSDSLTMLNDTLIGRGSNHGGVVSYYHGSLNNDFRSKQIVVDNIYYKDSAADLNIGFSSDADSLKEQSFYKTLNVTVQGSNNLPVTNANVKVTNAYGNVVLTTTTNSNGLGTGLVKYGYYRHPGDDSTGFNPMSILVYLGSDSTLVSSFTVGYLPANSTDTITLTETIGDGSWGLGHVTSIIDTTVSSFKLAMDFSGQTGDVDSVIVYKGAYDPADVLHEKITTPTDPDTSEITGLDDGIRQYFRTVMWDGITADTNVGFIDMWDSLIQTLLIVDTTTTSFIAQINYTANNVSKLKLVWDTNNVITSAIGADSTVSPTLPDTLQATGLSEGTTYYYWDILSDVAYTDTVGPYEVTIKSESPSSVKNLIGDIRHKGAITR